MLFKLDFANNTILSSFFLLFLIIDLYLLVAVIITQIFKSIVELTIPIEILTKEAKAEIEAHPVIVEIAISQCSI